MDNMTLLIDPETRDLVFDENGMLVQIYDEDTITQNVRHALLTWKKEFFADLEHGTDYDRIMGVPENDIDDEEVKEVIREAIFQEPYVSRISSMEVAYGARTVTVTFSAILTTGEQISLEVTA